MYVCICMYLWILSDVFKWSNNGLQQELSRAENILCKCIASKCVPLCWYVFVLTSQVLLNFHKY